MLFLLFAGTVDNPLLITTGNWSQSQSTTSNNWTETQSTTAGARTSLAPIVSGNWDEVQVA